MTDPLSNIKLAPRAIRDLKRLDGSVAVCFDKIVGHDRVGGSNIIRVSGSIGDSTKP